MSLSITSFTPETGIVGTEVTITGTGFGTAATVSFYNGISAVVDSCTDTTIATHVPIGATNGPITVAVDGADMNTSSLLHFQNRVWIFAGTAQIDISQQPFATGGSLLLDGDSDYLSTPDSADFAFGSGDLTIDFWFRLASDGADQCFISQPEGVGYSPIALIFQTSSKKISLFMSSDGSSWAVTQAGTLTYNATAWYHFAAVRNGNNWRTYQNGAIDIDITNSLALRDSASSFYVGSNGLGQYVNGSIGELRITKGLARWTADFSASLPTAKYADDANTVSLLHFDEADGSTFTKDVAANWTMDGAAQFYDETGKLWTVGGTAQLDTSVYKWTGSLLLDGNGDYISSSASDDFRYDADFTVDCWIRPAAVDGIRTFYDCRGSAGSSAGFALFIESGYIKVYCASRTITGLTLLVTGNWYHVAIARSGTDVKLFLGGTQEGSTWSTSANFSDGNAIVGQVIDNQHFFSGNIDELRISKGIARWIEDFAPSASEYALTEALSDTSVDSFTVSADVGIIINRTIPKDSHPYWSIPAYTRASQTGALIGVITPGFYGSVIPRYAIPSGKTTPTIPFWALPNWKARSVYEGGIILYLTLADLLAQTNPVASGEVNADLQVVCTKATGGDMGYYYQDLPYHFSLSEDIASAGYRRFKIRPLTDISEIRHPIYKNTTIILTKGIAEVNLQTYAILGRELVLGSHLPEIEPGDVICLTSSRRDVSVEKSQVLSETINGSVDSNGQASLITAIRTTKYTELYRC